MEETPSTSASPDTHQDAINRGKQLVTAAILCVLAAEVATLAVMYVMGPRMVVHFTFTWELMKALPRMIIESVMLFLLYRGHSWSRWIMVVFAMIGGLTLLAMPFSFQGYVKLVPSLIITATSGLMFACGGILWFSESVRVFLAHQRGSREQSSAKVPG